MGFVKSVEKAPSYPMKTVALLLVSVLALTPATALAQQGQPIYGLSITHKQKLKSEVLFQLRTIQQIRKFNTDAELALEHTRAGKPFSERYIDEFQRRNEQMRRRPDAAIERIRQ